MSTDSVEIVEAFESVWKAIGPQLTMPRTLVLDRRSMEIMEITTAEQQWLDRLNSPAGLKQLFPALKG